MNFTQGAIKVVLGLITMTVGFGAILFAVAGWRWLEVNIPVITNVITLVSVAILLIILGILMLFFVYIIGEQVYEMK